MSKTFFFLCVLGFILFPAVFKKIFGGKFCYCTLPCVDIMRYAHSAALVLRVLLPFYRTVGKLIAGINLMLSFCIACKMAVCCETMISCHIQIR